MTATEPPRAAAGADARGAIDAASADARDALARTRAWVRHAVVGLNRCPFAKGPVATGRVRWVVCEATEPEALLERLCAEIDALIRADAQAVETTLLVHPNVLCDFDDFNDFLDVADAAIDATGHAGILQIASFHPDYRFAGTAAGDIGNATNRSPHPMLQLLRESSIDRAVAAIARPQAIYEANIATLEALGAAGWERLAARWRGAPGDAGAPTDPHVAARADPTNPT